jgi:hypothetical protein
LKIVFCDRAMCIVQRSPSPLTLGRNKMQGDPIGEWREQYAGAVLVLILNRYLT